MPTPDELFSAGVLMILVFALGYGVAEFFNSLDGCR